MRGLDSRAFMIAYQATLVMVDIFYWRQAAKHPGCTSWILGTCLLFNALEISGQLAPLASKIYVEWHLNIRLPDFG